MNCLNSKRNYSDLKDLKGSIRWKRSNYWKTKNCSKTDWTMRKDLTHWKCWNYSNSKSSKKTGWTKTTGLIDWKR